jgi:Cd2+/Zn2+-exporting ATPase
MTATKRTTRFRVDGMDCASCAMKIETAARRTAGVQGVSVSVASGTMAVAHEDAADLDAMVRTITSLGYPLTPLLKGGELPVAPESCACCSEHEHGEQSSEAHDHGHGHGHGHEGDRSHVAVSTQVARADLHRHEHTHGAEDGPWWRSSKARLTLVSGAALAIAYTIGLVFPATGHWPFLAALALGLLPIARRAFVAAWFGTPFSIEMLMTIAAVGAVIIGAAEEAAAVVFLFLVGELLEGVAAARARASIRGLTDLVPRTARVERDGTITEVAGEAVAVGDIVVVRPGDRIPADGAIIEGRSSIDEAPVTGESVPKVKAPGDAVFAGTVNGDGLLRVQVSAAAADNTIARVVRLVEEAQESKAPTERFIDDFSRWYTPGVVLVAALVAILPPVFGFGDWGSWIYKGLAILLIGCPCALVISTPAAIAAGLSAGARRGLLMKGGAVLEQAGQLTAIALDKTGTLTAGKPKVTDVVAVADVADERSVLSWAAALETGSSHPLATAILAKAAEERISAPIATESSAAPGRGVEGMVDGARIFLGSATAVDGSVGLAPAEREAVAAFAGDGKSVSVLTRDGRVAGLIAMRDEPRADARRGLDALKAAGVRTVMLTGDNRATAEAVAASLGIEPRAELLPEDKQRIVREMQAEGHRVGKVGDGINDAPALAAADIGIAMGGGTDVALETADAAVLHGRVMDIADMIWLSRSVMSNIRQNIAIALGLKAVFLVTTVAGITGLWPAILADTGATVLVTANAMRLLSWRGTP